MQSHNIKNITQKEHLIKLETEKCLLEIYTLAHNIIRIRVKQEDKGNKIFKIIEPEIFSPIIPKIKDSSVEISIETDKLTILIDKLTTKIKIFNKSNIEILADFESLLLADDERIVISKTKNTNDIYFGLGDRPHKLDINNNKHILYNIDTLSYTINDYSYLSIPFIIATSFKDMEENNTNSKKYLHSYGLFFDNASKTVFDFRRQNNFSVTHNFGEIDYYFIYDENPQKILEKYTFITGRIKLPPIWALGSHYGVSKYKDFKNILSIIDNFKKKEIPCDSIHLDSQYIDNYKQFKWNKHKFPNPTNILKILKEKNINVIIKILPFIKKDKKYNIYKEGCEKKLFCTKNDNNFYYKMTANSKMAVPDFFMDETKDWWRTLISVMVRMGVKGIWEDMNEPTFKKFYKPELIENIEMYHFKDYKNQKHTKLRNLYAYQMSEATYNGLSLEKANERKFLLTRSGYTGIQKYGAVCIGELQPKWEHLQYNLTLLLNLSISGVSLCGGDISDIVKKISIFSKPSDDLYIRWLELLCLTPFLRLNIQNISKSYKLWLFRKNIENILKKYIKLRYKFIPYLYSYVYKSSISGDPIIRPLFYNYYKDINCYAINDEFMVGDNILVAPILNKSQYSRKIYLPQGEWLDYNTNILYQGEKEVEIDAPIEILPLFIKKGSIIPQYEDFLLSINDINKSILIIENYINNEGKFNLYEDDGLSRNYKKGEYSLLNLSYTYNSIKGIINYKITRNGEYLPTYKVIKIIFKNIEKIPLYIRLNKKNIVKVEENINFKLNTGICWFMSKSTNEFILILPNKEKKINFDFEIKI